jgi:predicted enzyme related to lactoylglutathione lyase
MTGRVVHFEVPFDDGQRARSFYRDAFGWELQEMPEMSYTMVTSGPSGDQGPTEPGYINGGMLDRTISPARGPVLTIDVDNIDDALATIEKLGGSTVVGRTAVADMGFSAYFTDSEGNVMGLWESSGRA